MPVSFDHPGDGAESLASFDLHRELPTGRIAVELQCHYCGFGPTDVTAKGYRCPKCRGHSWDRLVRHLDGFGHGRPSRLPDAATAPSTGGWLARTASAH